MVELSKLPGLEQVLPLPTQKLYTALEHLSILFPNEISEELWESFWVTFRRSVKDPTSTIDEFLFPNFGISQFDFDLDERWRTWIEFYTRTKTMYGIMINLEEYSHNGALQEFKDKHPDSFNELQYNMAVAVPAPEQKLTEEDAFVDILGSIVSQLQKFV